MFHSLRSSFTHAIGTTLLVAFGVAVMGSVILGALWIISAPGVSRYGPIFSQPNLSPPTKASLPHIAFPGVAFRPRTKGSDATGWTISYVLVNKDRTLVVSTQPRRVSQITRGRLQPSLTLSDNRGHLYQRQSDDYDLLTPPPCGDAVPSTRVNQVSAFAPLQLGATQVQIHHTVPQGGTVVVPINPTPLAALPRLHQRHMTHRSGRVRVTLMTVISGAIFSEADFYAHGFAAYRSNATLSTPPPQEPSRITIRTSSGQNLTPCVVVMPADEGAAITEVGFNTLPRGTIVTITVIDYVLRDLARNPRTYGRWAFTFSMP